MAGGSLIYNGYPLSEMSVGDSTVGASGSGPAVFNMSGGTLHAGLFGSEAFSMGFLTGGNSLGLVVGNSGSVGVFNQSGGLNVVHGYGFFALGARSLPRYARKRHVQPVRRHPEYERGESELGGWSEFVE